MNIEKQNALKEAKLLSDNKKAAIVCRLGKSITIRVDQYQYILEDSTTNKAFYFTSVRSILHHLLEDKMYKELLKDQRKDLFSIQRANEKSIKWIDTLAVKLENLPVLPD